MLNQKTKELLQATQDADGCTSQLMDTNKTTVYNQLKMSLKQSS